MKQKKTLRFLALFLTLLLLVTALPLSVFAAKATEEYEEEAAVSNDASPSSDAERETAPLRDGNDELMEGIYTIESLSAWRHVQVNNAATAPGSVVGLTGSIYFYEDHQQFLVRKVGNNNEYTFQPLHALSMGVASVGTLGAGVTIEPYDPDDPAQRFSVTMNECGHYVIRTKASNFQYVWSQPYNCGTLTEQVYSPDPYTGPHNWEQWDFELSGPTDGVYAFQYTSTQYANAVNNSQGTPVNVTNSYSRPVYQTTIANSPASSDSPIFTALFKLHYRPDTQDYIIRSMMDNLLILTHETDDCLLAKRNGVTDDTTVSNYSWKIARCGYDDYYIWYESSVGTRYYVTWTAANRLTVVNNIDYAAIWSFPEYTGTARNFRAYNYNVSPNYETVQSGAQIDVAATKGTPYNYSFYSTEIGVNTPGKALYRVRNTNGTATSVASITLATGILTFDPNKCGVVRVTISFVGGDSFYTDYYAPPTSNNIIVLQNIMGSVGYAKGFTSFATKAALSDGAPTDTQLWEKIQSPWTGYYYLRNLGNGLYLSVPDNTTMDADLVMVSSATGNRQAWKFTQTSSGQVKIRSRRDELANNNLYINVKPSSTRLIQGTFVQNSSYYDEFNVLVVGTGILCGNMLTSQMHNDPAQELMARAMNCDPYSLQLRQK